jgi:hypothetical protein
MLSKYYTVQFDTVPKFNIMRITGVYLSEAADVYHSDGVGVLRVASLPSLEVDSRLLTINRLLRDFF